MSAWTSPREKGIFTSDQALEVHWSNTHFKFPRPGMFTSQHVRSIWNTWPVHTDRHWAANRRGKDTRSVPANSHGVEKLPKSSELVFSRLWKCFEGERRTTSQPWERIKQNVASWLWNLECPHFGHCPNFLFPSSDALTVQTKPDDGKMSELIQRAFFVHSLVIILL